MLTKPVVAISAAYGAGGPIIAEKVATALGVPFLDQLFSAAQLAEQTRTSGATALVRHNIRGDLAVDDSYMGRAIAELATRDMIRSSDNEVQSLLTAGGVVLGRGGPHIFEDSPTTLRVLLFGPVEARIAAGAAREGIDHDTAVQHQRAADASRSHIAATHYGDDPERLSQYHLAIDTTALGVESAVRLILAAQAALVGPPSAG